MRGWFIKIRAVCKQRGRCQRCKGCDDFPLKYSALSYWLWWFYTSPNSSPTVQWKLNWSLYVTNDIIFPLVLWSRELGTTSIPYSPNREPASAPHQPLAPPSGPLAYVGGAEGRKRRSPSSYRGKANKLSRPGGLKSLFGNGSDSGGIMASGPDSPRQVGVTYRLSLYYPLLGIPLSISWIAQFWKLSNQPSSQLRVSMYTTFTSFASRKTT